MTLSPKLKKKSLAELYYFNHEIRVSSSPCVEKFFVKYFKGSIKNPNKSPK